MEKYFSVYGESKRAEYWLIQLGTMALFMVALMMGLTGVLSGVLSGDVLGFELAVFAIAIGGVAVWLAFANACRRIRDIGISAWWVIAWFLLSFLPLPWGLLPFVAAGCLPTDAANKDEEDPA